MGVTIDIGNYVKNGIEYLFSSAGETPITFFTFSDPEKQNVKRINEWIGSRPATSVYEVPPLDNSTDVVADGHPNEKGHEMISESIFTHLIQSGMYNCKH